MNRKLNVLFVPTSSSGVMWWRIQSFVETAWREGLANFVNPLWFKDLNTVQTWQLKLSDGPHYDPIFLRSFIPTIESGCVNADAVVFQYAHEEGAIELFEAIRLKFPHLPMLTEIDDNILSVPTYNEAATTFDPRSEIRERVIRQIRMSDGVIVSTPYLKEIYSEFNRNIWVVQNSIDFKQWDGLKRKSRPGIRIGWAGGNGHEGDILEVEGAIKRICEKHKDAKFVFINGPARSGLPEALKGIKNVEHALKWVPIGKYPQMMADMDFDIGIAPVMDSAFNRGKSNLKWLENAALKIPTVMLNVGHYAQTVTDGVDGFLANNDDEFFTRLDSLITDKKLRQRMGVAAYNSARKSYSLVGTTCHYIDCLTEAVNMKASGEIVPFLAPVTNSIPASGVA